MSVWYGLEKEFFKNIEEQALSTYTETLPLWLRYVDDAFTAVGKDEIDTFHEHFNRQNPHIQFTKEIEENGKISFLDCLVSHDENKLRTTIYRKPTHTDRLLDQSSYNPTSHKATTIQTSEKSRERMLLPEFTSRCCLSESAIFRTGVTNPRKALLIPYHENLSNKNIPVCHRTLIPKL